MGWVGSWVHKFTWQWVGLGWVSYLVGWVGSGSMVWTHGQLWSEPMLLNNEYVALLSVRRSLVNWWNKHETALKVGGALPLIHSCVSGPYVPNVPEFPNLVLHYRYVGLTIFPTQSWRFCFSDTVYAIAHVPVGYAVRSRHINSVSLSCALYMLQYSVGRKARRWRWEWEGQLAGLCFTTRWRRTRRASWSWSEWTASTSWSSASQSHSATETDSRRWSTASPSTSTDTGLDRHRLVRLSRARWWSASSQTARQQTPNLLHRLTPQHVTEYHYVTLWFLFWLLFRCVYCVYFGVFMIVGYCLPFSE